MKRKLLTLMAIMTLLFGLVACKKEEQEPVPVEKTFENELYSVVLTDEFEETTAEGYDWFLESKDKGVLFSYITKDRFAEMGYPAEYGLDELTTDIIGTDAILTRETNEGYNTFDYITTDEEGQEAFYYLVGVYGNEDKFLIVNFVCEASNRSEYESLFREWAGKVVLK